MAIRRWDVDREDEAESLLYSGVDSAARADRADDRDESSSSKTDPRRTREVGAPAPDGDPDVAPPEWGVVHSVAGHRHDLAAWPGVLDQPQLVQRCDTGEGRGLRSALRSDASSSDSSCARVRSACIDPGLAGDGDAVLGWSPGISITWIRPAGTPTAPPGTPCRSGSAKAAARGPGSEGLQALGDGVRRKIGAGRGPGRGPRRLPPTLPRAPGRPSLPGPRAAGLRRPAPAGGAGGGGEVLVGRDRGDADDRRPPEHRAGHRPPGGDRCQSLPDRRAAGVAGRGVARSALAVTRVFAASHHCTSCGWSRHCRPWARWWR